MHDRIANEVAHGRRIAAYAEEVWSWSGEAGRSRWGRRVSLRAGALPLAAAVERPLHALERLPAVREIGGSLLIEVVGAASPSGAPERA